MENITTNLTWRLTLPFLISSILTSPLLAQTTEPDIPNAWINEIHYDNASTDVGEAIELVVEDDPSKSYLIENFTITLYNGENQQMYATHSFPKEATGNPFAPFFIFTMPTPGIQNGDSDGIALAYEGHLIQFISYEGSFTALDGIAAGITSLDIGVSESSTTPESYSLQLIGAGDTYQTFIWSEASPETFGDPNVGQNLVPIDGPQPVTDFRVISIAPDKVSLAWRKPIGVHGEDWSGILVFGSSNGSNEINFENKDYSDFDGSLIFGDVGSTPTENGFTIARRQTDSNGEETITNLNANNYHFAVYTYLSVDGGDNDIFLEDYQEIEIAPKVADISNYNATSLDEKARLSWTNSMGQLDKWWSEIMVVASENPVTTVPDKASYSPSGTFGAGESLAPGEYVVDMGMDTVAFIDGLANGKDYHFKTFVRYDSGEKFFWSPGAETIGQPALNKKYWSGGAKTNNFSDDENWFPAGKPGISHDVVLDNSITSSSYEVFSSGDEDIALNSLTISPQSTSISIKFSSITDNSRKLILHDNKSPLTVSDYGIFINNITNKNGTVVIPNGKIVLGNEGKYIHNTGSGSKTIFDNIELNDGYIPGTIEFNTNTAGFISISGKYFQEIIFSSETNATYTSTPGSQPVVIKKALTINENCKLSLVNLNAPVYLEGDLNINGTIAFNNDFVFNGSELQSFSGNQPDPVQINNLVIDKPNSHLHLETSVEIINKLEFMKGYIETDDNKIILNFTNGNNPAIIGAPLIGKTIGNLETIRNVSPQETDFAYAGVNFKAGMEDLGAVSVIRSTAADTDLATEPAVLNRSWSISTAAESTTAREVAFTWLAEEENDLDLLNVQLWQESETPGEWLPLGDPQDGTSRTIAASVESFTKFAISDTHNPLPVTLLSFEVSLEEQNALLQWTTVDETNNAGFEIEKSIDGRHFYKIGFAKGVNNSLKRVDYAFKDLQFTQNSFYRLKQLDYDGEHEYSSIRFLSATENSVDVTIFPNPIDKELTIKAGRFSKEESQIDFCYLISGLGTKIYEAKAGNLTLIERELNAILPNLQRGIYILRLSQNSKTKNLKLVKK